MMSLLPVREIILLPGATNDYDMFVAAGSPAEPVNVFCYVTAAVGSTSTSTPAFKTGTGWNAASRLYLKNTSTISGKAGAAGTNGAGGVGADHGLHIPAQVGGNGTAGSDGGPSLSAGFAIQVDNSGGTITGGAGGGGGTGGGGGGGEGLSQITRPDGGSGNNVPGVPANGGSGKGGTSGIFPGGGGQPGDNGNGLAPNGASGGTGGTSGASGVATTNDSNITFLALGTIIGART